MARYDLGTFGIKHKCVIVRGVPGSGKTTFLRRHFPEFETFSADDFFTKADGSYVYDKSQIEEAHRTTLRSFVDAMGRSPFVAVDNTNMRAFELAPYNQVAKAFGYEVYIFTLVCNAAVATKRNVHGVSFEIVQAMGNMMEPLPVWCTQCIVTPDLVDVVKARDVVFTAAEQGQLNSLNAMRRAEAELKELERGESQRKEDCKAKPTA